MSGSMTKNWKTVAVDSTRGVGATTDAAARAAGVVARAAGVVALPTIYGLGGQF